MSSAAQSLPFFGRAWQISVDTADGAHLVLSSSDSGEALRVTFAVETYALLAYWTGTVEVFNMAAETVHRITQGAPDLANAWRFNQPLVAGCTVSVSAGYQARQGFNANANLIYQGKLLQPIWTRENVVDFKLKLRCLTGLLEDAVSMVSFSLAAPATDYDVLQRICSEGGIRVDVIDDAAAAAMRRSSAPRSQTFHGRPFSYIQQIAGQNNLLAWVSPRGLNVRSFDPEKPPATPDFAYAPRDLPSTGAPQRITLKRTMIGSPEQTQDGVKFRVLLDPEVKVGDVIQIAPGTLINLFPVSIGELPPIPSRNGLYVVAGVAHHGDTRGRGNDWYTEITGVVMDFFANFLQARNGR